MTTVREDLTQVTSGASVITTNSTLCSYVTDEELLSVYKEGNRTLGLFSFTVDYCVKLVINNNAVKHNLMILIFEIKFILSMT